MGSPEGCTVYDVCATSNLMQLVQWLKLLRADASVSEEQCTYLSNQLLEVLQRSTPALESLLVSHNLVLTPPPYSASLTNTACHSICLLFCGESVGPTSTTTLRK